MEVFNDNTKEDVSGHKREHAISPLLLIMTQPYQKPDGTAFKVLCVCICMSVSRMANSKKTWDSSQDNSFTA